MTKNPYGPYPSMIECIEKQLSRAENENPTNAAISDLCRTVRYTIHSGRFFCTKTHKYNRVIHGDIQVTHVDATEEWAEDGYPGGDIAHYKCPHCGETWSSEVAQ